MQLDIEVQVKLTNRIGNRQDFKASLVPTHALTNVLKVLIQP